MIVAVFSDVHANLLALEAFLVAVRGVADRFVCLGDIVNYGPWNDECLERIHSLAGIEIVEGNHDRMFLDEAELEEQSPLVQEFFRASRASFTRFDLLDNLPLRTTLGPFTCSHTIGGHRVFEDTEIEVSEDHLIGHTHWQYSIVRGGRRIVNPGSVGQNRYRIDLVDYALYDSVDDAVSLHSVAYDFESFFGEVRRRGWPSRCLDYYERKWLEARQRARLH